MTTKLTASERKQIILDHLQGIPNQQYEVKELPNGTYRVSRVRESLRDPEVPTPNAVTHPIPTAVTRPLHAEGSSAHQSPFGTPITNEAILEKLNQLFERQSMPQSMPQPMSEPPKGKPPNIEEVTSQTSVPKRSTGRRKLVLA